VGVIYERGILMIKKIIISVLILASLMYAEYRFIMNNLCPYLGENNTVYIELFGQVDEYYAEDMMPTIVDIEYKE
jgi:hypothetical protein